MLSADAVPVCRDCGRQRGEGVACEGENFACARLARVTLYGAAGVAGAGDASARPSAYASQMTVTDQLSQFSCNAAFLCLTNPLP
jgi:hypothetical protein